MRILASLFLLLLVASPVWAQRVHQPLAGGEDSLAGERIAAVVNDSIISTSDVRARMALAMLTSGLPDTPEVKQHLLPQALRSLVDEQLQIQEGKRIDINVTAEEIRQAINRIVQENNIPGGDMAAFLSSHGVPPATMDMQAKASLTWNKVIQRELRPRVDVGDDEVDAAVARMRANVGKEEYLVSEIYLAVDNATDEDQVKHLAESLVQQIKSGTSFSAVARQFSQSAGASGGGDIGWIQTGQLAPELNAALQGMKAGDIAGPLRIANGFHILGVREKRTISLGESKESSLVLQQAFRPFAGADDKENALKDAARLRQSGEDCKDLSARLAHDFSGWRWQNLGEVKLAGAPSWLLDKTRDVAAGHASEPLVTDKGALVLFVCERKMTESVNREGILSGIGSERMELLARRLLRDLRRDAYVDVRLGG